MIEKVTQYYYFLKKRIAPPGNAGATSIDQHDLNVKTGYGTLIYNSKHCGLYGIIDDQQNKYCLLNANELTGKFKDRKRVHFILRQHPNIANIINWGITSILIHAEYID